MPYQLFYLQMESKLNQDYTDLYIKPATDLYNKNL